MAATDTAAELASVQPWFYTTTSLAKVGQHSREGSSGSGVAVNPLGAARSLQSVKRLPFLISVQERPVVRPLVAVHHEDEGNAQSPRSERPRMLDPDEGTAHGNTPFGGREWAPGASDVSMDAVWGP